jgi:DNA-binding transcriptional LysR family regulator
MPTRRCTDSEALRGALQELTGQPAGTVRIGSIEGMVGHFLANNLARFQKRHPQVKVQASVVGSRAVLEALQEGRIDIALAFNLPAPCLPRARKAGAAAVRHRRAHACAGGAGAAFRSANWRRPPGGAARHALPDPHLVDRHCVKTQVALELVIETNTLDMAKGVVRQPSSSPSCRAMRRCTRCPTASCAPCRCRSATWPHPTSLLTLPS